MTGRIAGIAASAWGLFFLVFQAQSNSRYFALAAVFLIWAWRKVNRVFLFSALIPAVLVGLSLPFLTQIDLAQSIKARLEVFVNTGAMILDKPVFGHGTGSYNYNYHIYQEVHTRLFNFGSSVVSDPVTYAGNAHNEILQIWSEQGLIGLALALWFGFLLMRRRETGIHGAAWGTMVLGASLSMVGFPLHNGHTAALIAVAAGIMSKDKTRTVSSNWLVLCVLFAGLIGWASVQSYRAQIKMTQVREVLNNNPLKGLQANVDAYNIYPYDQHTRRQMILSLTKVTHSYKGNLDLSDDAADRIYQISRSAAELSPATEASRVEYLINSGRHLGNEVEIERSIASLKATYGHNYLPWMIEAMWASRLGDGARVLAAADQAEKNDPSVTAKTLAKNLRNAVKEISR